MYTYRQLVSIGFVCRGLIESGGGEIAANVPPVRRDVKGDL